VNALLSRLPALPQAPLLRGRRARLLRRCLAAALLLAGLVALFLPPSARGAPASQTVVAARDLPAGSVLRAADVRAVSLPDQLRPAGSFSSADAVAGRLLSGAARSGEPITDVRLLGNSLPVTGEPGAVTVPLRLADPAVAELLQPGQRVDVVTGASTTNSASVLARGAVVVTVRRSGEGDKRPLGSAQPVPLVLVAVPPQVATQVAASSLERPVAVTLR